MAQIRRAALETLTETEKADPVLASILTALREVRAVVPSVESTASRP